MLRILLSAQRFWLTAFAVLTLCFTANPARANAEQAAACFALIGGPTGAVAASLARGDLVKQLEGVYSNAQQASEASARYAEKNCVTWQNNPVFQALAASLTAMVADSKLAPNYKDAKGQIDAAIGKIVADVVKGALSNSSSPLNALAKQLPSDFVSRLENYIKAGAVEKIDKLLKENPFTAQLLSMFDCAVVVATSGAADQIKKKIEEAKQTGSDLQNCASFLASCTSPSDCLGSVIAFGEAVGKGVANLPGELWNLVKKTYEEAKEAVRVVYNAPGKAKEWIECHIFKTKNCGTVAEAPQCSALAVTCRPGFSREQCLGNYQKAKYYDPACTYTFKCQNGAPFQNIGGIEVCPCPAGLGYFNSACIACGVFPGSGQAIHNGVCKSWECNPPPGKKFVSYGRQYQSCNYENVCSAEKKVWVGGQNGSCQACAANTAFRQDQFGNASCSPCAHNETSQAGGVCQPLKCAGLSHPDKDHPHVCVACKNVTTVGGKQVCLDAAEKIDQRCPPGMIQRPGGGCMEAPKTKGISKDIEQKALPKNIEQKAPTKNIEQNTPKTRQ